MLRIIRLCLMNLVVLVFFLGGFIWISQGHTAVGLLAMAVGSIFGLGIGLRSILDELQDLRKDLGDGAFDQKT